MSGGWAGSDRRERLPADWPSRTAAVHERSGGQCECISSRTGRRCTNRANGGVDHIVRGDDHSLANLRDTCHWHHSKKSSAEGNAAKAALKNLGKKPPEGHPGRLRP